MVYYMTVSGHLNYNFMGNNMAAKNRDLVKDLPDGQDRIKFRDSYSNYPLNEMLPLLMEMLALDFIADAFEDFEEDAKTITIPTVAPLL